MKTLLLVSAFFSFISFAGEVKEFHIKAGTGKGAWNTRDAVMEVKVGDTLRLVNDDNVAHYLHTFGKPCIHGTKPFGPGESYDCQVIKVADPDKDVCYDHQFGSQSRFYVRATN